MEGHILVISKALYGLRSSSKCWSERLADCLCEMGFTHCKAEPDIWMRKKVICVSSLVLTLMLNLALAAQNPKEISEELQTNHNVKLKGIGPNKFYLGCDFYSDDVGVLSLQATSNIY